MLKEIKVDHSGETAFRPYKLKYGKTIYLEGCGPVRCYHYGTASICVSNEGEAGAPQRVISLSTKKGHFLPDKEVGSILVYFGMDPTRAVDCFQGPPSPNCNRERTQYYCQSVEAGVLS